MAKLRYKKYEAKPGDIVELKCYGWEYVVKVESISTAGTIYGRFKYWYNEMWVDWVSFGSFSNYTNLRLAEAIHQRRE
jgi:hypothetical protein